MKDKIIRLLKALSNESVKRLPYTILIGLVLIFIQFIHLNNQTAEGVKIATNNSADSKTLLKKVAALSEDNKKLTQQNLTLAKENSAHLDCVAKLFAQYTRDLRPIYDIDLDQCFITEGALINSQTTTVTQPAAQPLTNTQTPPILHPKPKKPTKMFNRVVTFVQNLLKIK